MHSKRERTLSSLIIAIVSFALILASPASAGAGLISVALTSYSKYWNDAPGLQFYGLRNGVPSDDFAIGIDKGYLVIYDFRSKPPAEAQRIKMAGGMYATNALLRGTNVHVIGRFGSPHGIVQDGFQTWNLSLTDPKAHPALVQTYQLETEGGHAQFLTSLSGGLDVVYLTSYIQDSVFVETGHTHIVQSGETVWRIARDELCGGNAPCAFQKWPELLALNPWIPYWTTDDGVTIALIHVGDEVTVAPSRYETTYTSTIRKIQLVGAFSPAKVLAQMAIKGQKFELSYPDPNVSAQNLWTTDEQGRDHQYLLEPASLKIAKDLKSD